MRSRLSHARAWAADGAATAAAWGFERGVGALPDGAARLLGRSLARAAYGVLRIRRSVVEDQLFDSFPERDVRWVRETARACYRHFGEEFSVLAGGPRRVEAALAGADQATEIREVLEAALTTHGGAILVTGHLGNWEVAGAGLASLGLPTTAVVKRQRGSDRRINALRTRFGLEVAYRDDSPKVLLRALRQGRVVALVADQHAKRGGIQLDFLGRPAWTTLGPARLCLAAKVPLFFGVAVRDRGRYRGVFEEIDRRPTSEEAPRVQLTRRWLAALEGAIRTWPEQYFWFHRRWKGLEAERRSGNVAPRAEVQEAMEKS